MNHIIATLCAICTVTNLQAQQSFTFVDRTEEVRMRPSLGNPLFSEHTVNIFDHHMSGGALVDLNDDDYPELILPAPRANSLVPDQDLGGFYIIKNVAAAGGGREFDYAGKIQLLRGTGAGLSDGTEVSGILAADFDNDGDIDLFITCGGELDSTGPLQDHLDAINTAPFAPSRNHLLLNQGGLVFLDSISGGVDKTDPTTSNLDGHGLGYTQSPDTLSAPPNPPAVYADPEDWTNRLANTEYPSNTVCAAAADVNRDGLLDIYIAHDQTLDGTSANGLQRPGQMDALYLNLGDNNADGFPEFWDVTYDRGLYEDNAQFTLPGGVSTSLPNTIAVNEYMPVFGLQASCNCRWSFNLPCNDPIYRFSSTNGITFTDLNEDGWPDLIVTGKGYFVSPYQNARVASTTGHWLDETMVYINRGENGNGRWMGFWNRTWDMMLQGKDHYRTNQAPMGIAVADYDMDGHMDFLISDLSSQGQGTGILNTTADLYRNETKPLVTTGGGGQDLRFHYSGDAGRAWIANDPEAKDTWNPGGATDADMHGPNIMTGWFTWGMMFADFDNDGDQDSYLCSQYGMNDGISTTPYLLGGVLSNGTGVNDPGSAYDRLFENTRVGNPEIFEPSSVSYAEGQQFIDYNPDDQTTGTPPLDVYQRPYLAGFAARRFDTHNVLVGDYDLDGLIDLIALPGPENNTSSLQVFHNESTAAGNMILLKLKGIANTTTPIGARVKVIAKLNGTDNQAQFLELRAGENHGASTNTLLMEVGVGAHPVSTPLSVEIEWPSGLHETFAITSPAAYPGVMTLTQATGTAATYSAPFLGPLYSSGGNLEDGMLPVQIHTDVTFPNEITSSELTLCPATVSTWVPVSMDHIPDSFNNRLDLEFIPLRFPVKYNAATVQLEPMTIYARVRATARGRQTVEVGMTAPFFSVENQPESRPIDTNTWTILSGATIANDPVYGEVIDIDMNGEIETFLEFPGNTNSVMYHLVLTAVSTTGSNGQMTLSCPNLIGSVDFTEIKPIGGGTPRAYALMTFPSFRGSSTRIVFKNTGTEQVRLQVLDRGMSSASTCLDQ